jgi:hypothetical protein
MGSQLSDGRVDPPLGPLWAPRRIVGVSGTSLTTSSGIPIPLAMAREGMSSKPMSRDFIS